MSFQHMLAMASGAKSTPPPQPPKPVDRAQKQTSGVQLSSKEPRPRSSQPKISPGGPKVGGSSSKIPLPKAASKPRPVANQSLTRPPSETAQTANQQKPISSRMLTKPKTPGHPLAKPKPKSTKVSAPVGAASRGAPASGKAAEGAKKLSFRDIMKKANSIDKDKLKMTIKTRDEKPESKIALERANARKSKLAGDSPSPVKSQAKPPISRATRAQPVSAGSKGSGPNISAPVSRKPSAPAPVAQPFPELLERRKKMQAAKKAQSKKARDDDSDLSDFIVYSEDEELEVEDDEPASSHREEIWQMFNRRPREQYNYDSSDDDMEASGGQILDEEKRSFAQARREDRDEQRRLDDLAARKRMRLQGKNAR